MNVEKLKSESALKFFKPRESIEVVNPDELELHDQPTSKLIEVSDRQPPEVVIIEQLPQNVTTTIKDLNEKTEEILVHGCRSAEEISNFLTLTFPTNESSRSTKTLVLRFQIAGSIELQSRRLNDVFASRDVIVTLEGGESKKSSIYWRSNRFKNFATLMPFSVESTDESKKIQQHVVDFLVDSLCVGHSGILSSYTMNAESTQIDLNLLADTRNYNLLLLAAEQGNAEIVRILLKLGMITDFLHTDAQTLAWENRHSSVLLELLREDLPYPKSFDIKKCSLELKEFYNISLELHGSIKAKNEARVKEIVDYNPNFKHFYNSSNESALKIAIDSKAPKIYDILLEHKLRFAPHEDAEELYKGLKYEMKRTLREIHNKYSQVSDEKHLNILMANSYISHDNENAKRNVEKIQQAFRTLNTNLFIKIILMIIAASKKFKIIFDFNRDSVNVADPTVESNTQGLFYLSGRIYIGAKQLLNEATEHETFGVLAHELCHYAMNVVFGNDARPYKSNDHETKREFEKISEDCRKNYEKEEIVDLVYDCYPEEAHHAELIVRVVHMLAFYYNQADKLQEVRRYFSSLFNFYENKIIPDMKAALPAIEAKVEEEINKKDKKISKLKKISIFLGLLSVLGILTAIAVAYVLHEPSYTFSGLSAHDQLKVKNGSVYYKNVEVKLQDLFSNDSRAYDTLESDHILFLLEGKALNFSDPHLHYLDKLIMHDWEHLAENLKEKIFDSLFIFQNQYLFFSKLRNVSRDAFNALTSKQICYMFDEVVEVGKMIESEVEFYIDREFFTEDMYAIYYYHMNNSLLAESGTGRYVSQSILYPKQRFVDIVGEFNNLDNLTYSKRIEEIKKDPNFKILSPSDFKTSIDDLISYKEYHFDMDDIIEIVESSKIFILSSEGGMGKTVAFEQLTKEIKAKFPTRWVSYIDLKNHTSLYKDEKLDDIEQFLAEILRLSSENEFERKIFEELYKSGNVVLLWNGFDEISPTYSNFILNVLQSVQSNTSNVQYVCTRPLYSDSLRFKLSVNPWALVPFDSKDQKLFLCKFFDLKYMTHTDVNNRIKKVENIIEKLKSKHRTVEYVASFDSPLMLNMIAEIVNDDDGITNTENLYQIYEKFVSKKIEIWQDKSIFAKSFINNLLSKGRKFNLLEFFQMYALKNEFGQDYYHCARLCMGKLDIFQQKVPQNLPRDEISRMGILYTSREDDYRFAHKTFAEFFVAQYLVENIYNADKVDRREAELRIEMLHYVSENFISGHIAISNFISAFLETQTENDYENFNPVISDVLRTKYKILFFNLLDLCTRDTYSFIFNFFKKDRELLNELLHISEDETLYTAGKNPYYAHNMPYTNNCPRYWIDYGGQMSLTESEYEKLKNGQNQKGVEVCGYQLRCFLLNYGCFRNVTEENFFEAIILSELGENEIIELLISRTTPLMHAVTKYGSYFNFKIVSGTAKKFLRKHDLQKFFSNFIDIYAKENLTINGDPYIALKNIEKLSNDDEIFNLFTERNFLHKAANSGRDVFEILWNFFANHTSLEKQKTILKQSIWEDGWLCNRRHYGSLLYGKKKCYGYPQVTILLTSLISFKYNGNYKSFGFVTELYENYFKKSEIQNMILASNDFMPYVIQYCNVDSCQKFTQYLKELFKGNERVLKRFLSHPIEKTRKDIFQYMEEYYDVQNQLKILRDLQDELDSF